MQRVRVKYAGATRFHVSHPAFASRVDKYGRRSDEIESGSILEIADHWKPEDFAGLKVHVEFLDGESQSEQPVEDQVWVDDTPTQPLSIKDEVEPVRPDIFEQPEATDTPEADDEATQEESDVKV